MAELPALPDRPIVLVGMMGAGKTSVGRIVAARLGLSFADSDDEVERATGLGVAEIFRRHGEAWFRDRERRAVAALLERGRAVIAAGGGAFVDRETRLVILERGRAVWLDAPVGTLEARVAGSARPLLADAGALARLAAERRPAYAEAHFRVAGGGEAEEVAAAVLAALAEPAR